MKFKMPQPGFLTFHELRERWQCTDNQLRHAIVSSEIKPAILFDGHLAIPDWIEDEFDEFVAEDVARKENYEEIRVRHIGALFLQKPKIITAWDCEFRLASNVARPNSPDSSGPFQFDNWYWLDKPVGIDALIQDGIFLLSEIRLFESKHLAATDENIPLPSEKPLTSRERSAYLNIIGAMLELLKSPKPGRDTDAAVIAELVENYGDKHGISESNLNRKFPEAKRNLIAT